MLENIKDKDITGHLMPNLIYVSREKNTTAPHYFKAGALNILVSIPTYKLAMQIGSGFSIIKMFK